MTKQNKHNHDIYCDKCINMIFEGYDYEGDHYCQHCMEYVVLRPMSELKNYRNAEDQKEFLNDLEIYSIITECSTCDY